MAKKKPIVSSLGQWAYPGEVTIIPSSNITMKGVNYPVLGIDDLGNSQMMMPGQDYNFPGDYVTEIPQMGKGGLAQWFAEEWTDVKTGKPCGRSGKEKGSRPYPACRPKKRVNETTPKTTSEMSSAEKAKFKREKTSGKRIDYNHKRREDGGETWLDQYQAGGWAGWTPNVGKPYMRTSPAGNAGYTDNTRVVNQNTNVSAANRKAAEAAEYAKRIGSISQGKTKSDYEKAKEASSFVSQAKQRKGSADPLDYVLDFVNPATYGFAGTDLVGNASSAVSNAAQGNFKEAGSDLTNAAFNALTVAPIVPGVRAALPSVAKYVTTQTPLKNAYKYNPWAFKPNPEAYYHRSPNIENIINQEKGILQGFGESKAGAVYNEFVNTFPGINLKKGANNQLYFSKGVPLDYGRYNPKTFNSAGKPIMSGQGYRGPYLVEVEGVPMGSSTKGSLPGKEPIGLESYAVSKRPISLDQAKFYKEDWLRGYKPIEVSNVQPATPQSFNPALSGFVPDITNTRLYKGAFQKYPKGPLTQEEITAFKNSPAYLKSTKEQLDFINQYGDSWKLPNYMDEALANQNRNYINPELYGGNNWEKSDYITAGLFGAAYPAVTSLYGLAFSPPAVKNRVLKNVGIQGPAGGLSSRDTTIDITNSLMDFAKVNEVKDGNIIIGGEFIEDANNTVRKAKDWLSATDTYSDKKYPSKDIQSFYGVENGKFKVGKANEFNPDTEIVPRRFGEANISKAVLNGKEMRLLDNEGNPIYQNTPNTGKFILYSPSTGKSQFTYINDGKAGVTKVNDFLKKNKDAQYIHLDNGRYEYYGLNPEGLSKEDYQNYYEQDLKREGNPGYNLIIKDKGGQTNWLDIYQDAGEVPFDVERMQGADIRKKRSWLDKLKGVVHRGERAIGLDPYNERSDDFFEQLARRINTATGGKDWYKQPNDASGAGGLPTAMMETVMAPFSIPQLAATYGVTGKVQTPSQAMDIQNPVGAFLTDAALDPLSYVGAGLTKTGQNFIKSLPEQINKAALSQINKNPRLALSLQRGRPVSLDNVNIVSGIRYGDVSSVPNFNKLKPNTISEIDFFKQLEKGVGSLDNSLQKRVADLESEEGFRRLVDQEKDYLFHNSDLEESALERVAKINARARIDELKNTRNINKEAAEYASSNFLNTGIPNNFVGNSYLYDNAYRAAGYDDVLSNMLSKRQGFNLVKPTPNYSKSVPGEIGIGYNYVGNKPTEMHEIAHSLQRGRKLSVDDQLRNIVPKKELTRDQERAYKYFRKGSDGHEPSAFANELRESMLQVGIIPDYYSPISQQQIQDAYKYFKTKPMGTYDKNTGKFLSNTRILDFMAPNQSNSKLLSNILNKLPAVAPYVVGAATASQLLEQKNGGWLNKYK